MKNQNHQAIWAVNSDMPGPPTISVVITTYNSAEFVSSAVESVLAQTAPAHEIIVVDDGSTDETQAVLQRYAGRIVIIGKSNGGCASARNAGICRATGEWIALLDSDDIWKHDKLERQCAVIDDDPRLVCVHTNFYTFGDRCSVSDCPKAFQDGRHTAEILLSGAGWVCPSSAVFRRRVPTRFAEWAPPAEDVCFFSELTFQGSFRYVAEPLVGHRIHGQQATKRADAVLRGTEAEFRWLKEVDAPQQTREELEKVFFRSVTKALERAKRGGHWRSYWLWRKWLRERWPAHLPVEKVVEDDVSPVFILRCVRHAARRAGSILAAKAAFGLSSSLFKRRAAKGGTVTAATFERRPRIE
jgi:glycosyltransferase involved in cell wall biosynthesis